MLKIKVYKLDKNPEQGFTIQEDNSTSYSIWHDPYQGGYAYDPDWYKMDNIECKSFDEAYKFIVDNYGSITEIEDD